VDETNRRALVDRLVTAHNQVFRMMRTVWAKEWLTADLTLPQMKVLFLLEEAGELSMSQLAEALGKAQPTITGLIDRLVEHNLVNRAESLADRRVTLVRLATSGRDLIARLVLAREEYTRLLVSRLTIDQLQLVAAAFDLLSQQARELAIKATSQPLGGDTEATVSVTNGR
jgi:DNA-binding MarR family transcriptional regulator